MPPINNSTSSAIFWWKPAAWLHVSGADSLAFLQGQFTNELRTLAPSVGAYGLWLNVKGKVVADSFIVSGASKDEFWIGSYYSPAAVIRERLEAFVIADDVVIEDRTEQWSALSILSAQVTDAECPAPGVRFSGRRWREASVEYVFPNTELAAVRARWAGRREIDEDMMTRRRIEAGIPAAPVDIGPADLPNEAGLESDAISFTKGCYLGQEVMARLKSMGRVRRRLLRVRGENATLPAPGTSLFSGGRPAGELRSAVSNGQGGCIGLAMLSLLALGANRDLALTVDGPPVWHILDTP